MLVAELTARDVEGALLLNDAIGDIARCMGDGISQGLDPQSAIYVAGSPRDVARVVPDVEVCDCRVLAVGVARDAFCGALREVKRVALARDLDAPLAKEQIRVLLILKGSVAVVTIKAPTPDFSTAYHCDGRPT